MTAAQCAAKRTLSLDFTLHASCTSHFVTSHLISTLTTYHCGDLVSALLISFLFGCRRTSCRWQRRRLTFLWNHFPQQAFTHSKLLHRDAFTQKAFTQRPRLHSIFFCAETLLHKERVYKQNTFTHRKKTFTHSNLLHKEVFTERRSLAINDKRNCSSKTGSLRQREKTQFWRPFKKSTETEIPCPWWSKGNPALLYISKFFSRQIYHENAK